MRIFTRYILREVLSHALLGGALFTFIFFMRDLGKILELVVRDSASFLDVARIFLYYIPNTLTLTIPMAVLVGVVLGLSRLASDSEVTAMRACGIGVFAFVRIVAIVAAAGWFIGLANSLYLAPRAATSLLHLEASLKSSQAGFEVQPRVFYEDFRNYVLYVQDVQPGPGAAQWKHVFLADLSQPASPHVTTAEQAIVLNEGDQTVRVHLRDGSQHQISPTDPNQYNISTFSQTDLPIQTGAQDDTHLGHSDMPRLAMSLPTLITAARLTTGREELIELNKRFSYPVACFVLMLVGVPIGLSSRRGGKSAGFVLTILLVFIYYFFSSVAIALARQHKIGPTLGVWAANIIFTLAGLFLLRQMARGGVALSLFASLGIAISKFLSRFTTKDPAHERDIFAYTGIMQRVRRTLRSRFPLILDDYIMREFITSFALILATFITLSLVFSFFELLSDIIRNRTPLITVGDYLINLIPFMVYNLTPLCALIAVLVTLGSFQRSSELTAMKATGISLYRVVAPILVIAAVLAAGLFAFEEWYLPSANRRQEALRSVIKGKPAQTFLRPDRKWISGQSTVNGEPDRIFYYQFFDPDKNVFANLTVFEFQPGTFNLQRRIFAANAHWDTSLNRWVFESGWQRTFNAETIASYQPFTLNSFPEIRELPTYFKKETRQSQEMSYTELSSYIRDLKQSGFDTMRLRVQLNRKIAYPLITLVMAILAVPFALSMGKRGSLAGVGTAIAMAIAYWVVAGTFEAMGNVNTLPAVLAAWSPDILFGFAGAYLLLRTPT